MEIVLSNEYIRMAVGIVTLTVYVVKVVPWIINRIERSRGLRGLFLPIIVILIIIGVAIFRFFMGAGWWESMAFFE